MRRLIAVWNRIKGTPAGHEQGINDELEFHREMKERAFRAAGMNSADARLEARRAMGNVTLAREEAREAWTFTWIRDALRDFRFGARAMAAEPGFAAAALLALILGIGVNAVVFSVYNTLVLAPYGVRDAGQTVQILAERDKGRWSGVSWPYYKYLRDNTQTLSGLVASDRTGVRITRGGEASWSGLAITTSDNFFDVLGTGFAAGRGFSPLTNPREPAPEVVLHYDTWMSHFGGDVNAIGEWIELNGHRLQITGVAAPGFNGTTPSRPELWITVPWREIFHPGTRIIESHDSCCVELVGRLRSGSDRATVLAELNTLSARYLSSVKFEKRGIMVTDNALLANPTQYSKAVPFFLAMGLASLLILLLACANVGNLQLARTVARRREIAMRLSLGASRGRILRQLFAESLVPGSIAGVCTLFIAAWLPGWLVRFVAGGANEVLGLRFENDWRVAAFIAALTMLSAVVFGMLPAIGAVRSASAADGLRDGSRTVTGGNRIRSVLLGVQVALCAILLTGASLLMRALDEAKRFDPGFRYADVIVMSPNLASSGVRDTEAPALINQLSQRIGALPGVVSVAHVSVVPLGNSFDLTAIADPNSKEQIRVGYSTVSAGFFDTIGVPLLAGRTFTAAEEGRTDTAIISEALAKRLYPDGSPLGKTLDMMSRKVEIIGVARDFNIRELGPRRDMQVFVPGRGSRGATFLIQHSQSPATEEALLAALPRVVKELNPKFLASVAPYQHTLDNRRRSAMVAASIAGGLGGLALLLACVGIYGVAAYNVSQRTREIGIRLALGARADAILRLILGQNLRTVLIGALIGGAGAIAFARTLTSMLFGVRPGDPVATAAAIGVLLATAVLSTLAPARKAAGVDPAITLRHD